MNIKEISKPVTAQSLNENLAKRFGKRITLDKFTLEQLQDARNKVRTKLSQVETTESFDTVYKEDYQKSKMFLDVLNAAIKERENIAEKAKNPYAVGMAQAMKTTGDKPPLKKSTITKAHKIAKKVEKNNESVIREGAEDAAELVMAAKNMVDRVTGWMEDTAEMQTESMLELSDAIRDEMGQAQSEAFVNAVKPALEALYSTMEETRTALTQGVGMLTGEVTEPETIGSEEPELEPELEPTVDDEEIPADDEFAAAAPAVGGEEEAGRAKRESVDLSRRLGTILSKKK
jgi:hypothetical protein